MNLSDLKVGDRFIVAGVTDVFRYVGWRSPACYTARDDNGDLTIWTYDAECDLYDSPA